MNSCSRTKTIQSARLGSPWISLWNKPSSINFWATKIFLLCLKVTYRVLKKDRLKWKLKNPVQLWTGWYMLLEKVTCALKLFLKVRYTFQIYLRRLLWRVCSQLPDILVSSILCKRYFMALNFGCINVCHAWRYIFWN